MDKRINVAIIGVQGYGRTYFDAIQKEGDVKILAVCDNDEQAAQEIAAKYGVEMAVTDYRQLVSLDTIDAVFIATPHFLHYPMTMAFLLAGKHVFCEKPLAIKTEQAWEMARTSRQQGVILTCHYNRRQSLPVKMLRDVVQKGVLGEVYAMNVKWMARWTGFMFQSNTSWRVSKAQAGGGILIGRGSHMLDAALHILGYPKIRTINAHTASRLANFEVDDYAFVSLRLADGGLVNMECSYENNIPHYQEKIEYEVFGTKAGAYCSVIDREQAIKIGYCAFPKNEWVDLTEQVNPAAYEEMEPKTIVGDFLRAVRQQCDPVITAEQGAYITQILETAYRSSEAGCEISLES